MKTVVLLTSIGENISAYYDACKAFGEDNVFTLSGITGIDKPLPSIYKHRWYVSKNKQTSLAAQLAGIIDKFRIDLVIPFSNDDLEVLQACKEILHYDSILEKCKFAIPDYKLINHFKDKVSAAWFWDRYFGKGGYNFDLTEHFGLPVLSEAKVLDRSKDYYIADPSADRLRMPTPHQRCYGGKCQHKAIVLENQLLKEYPKIGYQFSVDMLYNEGYLIYCVPREYDRNKNEWRALPIWQDRIKEQFGYIQGFEGFVNMQFGVCAINVAYLIDVTLFGSSGLGLSNKMLPEDMNLFAMYENKLQGIKFDKPTLLDNRVSFLNVAVETREQSIDVTGIA